MKRTKGRSINEHSYKPHDTLDIGEKRLSLFGAVSLAWNDLEGALDATLGAATGLPEPLWVEITSRINGFDGKCALLKKCCKIIHGMPEEHLTLIADTLGTTETHKRYRDGIIHAKILDPDSPTAPTFERKGAVGEVVVTTPALRNLYTRIRYLSAEIQCMLDLFTALKEHEMAETEDEKQSAEQQAKAWIPQLKAYQHQRKSLPPLPKVPEELQGPLETEGHQENPDQS